jgi:hypothetical protein
MEGVARNSKLERVEKENLDMKRERTSFKARLVNQRRYLKEVQEAQKRLATSNEATKAAKDRAKVVVETPDSLNKQLDVAHKDMKTVLKNHESVIARCSPEDQLRQAESLDAGHGRQQVDGVLRGTVLLRLAELRRHGRERWRRSR